MELKRYLKSLSLFSVPINGTFGIAKEGWKLQGFCMGIFGSMPISSLESAFNGSFTKQTHTGLWSAPGGITPAIYNKTSDSNLEERFIFTRIRVYFRYSPTITSIKRCVSAIVFLAMLFKSVLSNNRNLRLCFSFSYKNKFPQRFITVSRAFYEPFVRRANKRPAHTHTGIGGEHSVWTKWKGRFLCFPWLFLSI